MATIMDILTVKGRQVFSIGPDATVFDAALLMKKTEPFCAGMWEL